LSTNAAGTTIAAEQLQTSADALGRLLTNEIGLDVSQPLNSDFLVPETIPGSEWNGDDMLSLSMPSNSFFSSSNMGMIVNYMSQAPPVVTDAEETILPTTFSATKSFDIFMANQPPLTSEELNSPALLELASQICYTRQHEILGQKLVSAPLILSKPMQALTLPSNLRRLSLWERAGLPKLCL
jgi:hypothetical protein